MFAWLRRRSTTSKQPCEEAPARDGRKSLGRTGEKAAVEYLKRQGFRILQKNFKCSMGELDIIGLRDDTIVFVEVKTVKAHDALVPGERFVKRNQYEHAERAAKYWLTLKRWPKYAYRFDALRVIISESKEPEIEHIVSAHVPAPERFR